jgi:hypothetical protein
LYFLYELSLDSLLPRFSAVSLEAMDRQQIARCGWCGVKTALDERARYLVKTVEHEGGYEETQT